MDGMFGQDPAMLQQQLQQERNQQAMQLAQQDFGTAAAYGMGQGAGMLAQGLGSAAGYQDPRMADAMLGQQIQAQSLQEAQMAGIDPATDYEGFGKIAANNWLKAGKPERAYAVMQSIQGMQAKQADIGLKQAQAQKALREDEMKGVPDIGKLQMWRQKVASAVGEDSPQVKQIDMLIEKETTRAPAGGAGGAMQERMIEQVIQTRMPNASEQEKAAVRSAMYSQMLSQPKTGFDPVTMQPYSMPGISLPKELSGQVQQQPTVAQVGRKPLVSSDLDTFVQQTTAVDQLKNVQDSFKDKYAGFVSKSAGETAIGLGQRGIDQWKDTADWWGNYQRWLTDIMKGTFGASLTQNEKTQIEKFTAHPGMSKDVLKKNLSNQIGVVENSISKRATALANAGFSQDQIDSLLNPTKTTTQQGAAITSEDIVSSVMASNKSPQQKIKILTDLKNAGFQ